MYRKLTPLTPRIHLSRLDFYDSKNRNRNASYSHPKGSPTSQIYGRRKRLMHLSTQENQGSPTSHVYSHKRRRISLSIPENQGSPTSHVYSHKRRRISLSIPENQDLPTSHVYSHKRRRISLSIPENQGSPTSHVYSHKRRRISLSIPENQGSPTSDDYSPKTRRRISVMENEGSPVVHYRDNQERYILEETFNSASEDLSTSLVYSHKKSLPENIENKYAHSKSEEYSIQGQKETEMSTIVESSEIGKKKKHFCIYCKKRIINFGRHLETHKDEADVQKFIHLRKGTKERRAIIDLIRRKGDAEQNSNKNFNDGTLIVCRRPQAKKQRSAFAYECCPRCLGYFSKITFRRHYIKCIPNVEKGDRSAMVNGRRVRCQLHSRASVTLKNKIFPVMREDNITRLIRYDELAILYGNKLCEKYKSPHHHKMIRSRLRAVGHFLIEVKKHSRAISDFASCFQPKYINIVFKAINSLGGLDEFGIYKTPSTVFDTGTMFRKCANILDKEYMITKQKIRREDLNDFLILFNDDFSTSITNAVNETKLQMRRRKRIVLPDIEDIKKLNFYLREERRKAYNSLLTEYDFLTWKNLSSLTLISIQIFNRRRAGEIERLHIDDFLNYQEVNEKTDKEIYRNLSDNARKAAKQYVRVELRGKRARCVSVLMHKEIVKCLKLILKHRKKAGVPTNNQYLFGLPSVSDRLLHLDACVLMRKFSKLCGASNSELLRGTQLRKHIATHSVTLDLQETEVADLANFMGHAEKIHREHYRLPIVTREIANISKFLLAAQGEDQSDVDEENDFEENDFEENLNFNIQEVSTQSVDVSNYSLNSERSVSPFGKTSRRSWSTPEKVAMKKLFKTNLENANLPSLNACATAVGRHSILRSRTAAQIKAWVNNQIKRDQVQSEPTTVRYWRTPEREVAKRVFATFLKNRRLPSLNQCAVAISDHSELKERKPAQLKAFINNEIQRHIKADNSIRRKLF